MVSEYVSPWHRALTIQRFRRPAERVPSAVVSRSAEVDHCKDAWKDSSKITRWKKKKIMKETIIIPMLVAVAVASGIMAEEDAEDAEEVEEVAAEEAAIIVSI
jgi:hypothetical protein